MSTLVQVFCCLSCSTYSLLKSWLLLISTNSLEKHVVFVYSLVDIPFTGHASWKGHKISLDKCHRLSTIGRSDSHFAGQNIARFSLTVGPREGSYITTPRRPVGYSLGRQKFVVNLRHDLDFWFAKDSGQ